MDTEHVSLRDRITVNPSVRLGKPAFAVIESQWDRALGRLRDFVEDR